MQAIVVVVMAYERICSTARAIARGRRPRLHSPYHRQYLALTDRAAHVAYMAAVAAGAPPAHLDPFS